MEKVNFKNCLLMFTFLLSAIAASDGMPLHCGTIENYSAFHEKLENVQRALADIKHLDREITSYIRDNYPDYFSKLEASPFCNGSEAESNYVYKMRNEILNHNATRAELVAYLKEEKENIKRLAVAEILKSKITEDRRRRCFRSCPRKQFCHKGTGIYIENDRTLGDEVAKLEEAYGKLFKELDEISKDPYNQVDASWDTVLVVGDVISLGTKQFLALTKPSIPPFNALGVLLFSLGDIIKPVQETIEHQHKYKLEEYQGAWPVVLASIGAHVGATVVDCLTHREACTFSVVLHAAGALIENVASYLCPKYAGIITHWGIFAEKAIMAMRLYPQDAQNAIRIRTDVIIVFITLATTTIDLNHSL